MKNALALAVVSIAIGACSSPSDSPAGSGPTAGAGGGGGAAGGAGAGGAGAGGAGAGGAGAGGVTTTPGTIAVLAGTVCGNFQLASAQTIPAGQTVTMCAGTTLTATTTDAAIIVQGTLMIAGTAQSPVKLAGQGHPGDWQGIDIQRGGGVSATYLEIHDAGAALSARAGSTFDIDHLLVDNSNQLLLLASGGTLAHGALHGLGDNQGTTPVFIDDASPRITDTVVDQGAYGGVDNIVVVGINTAAVFDHVEVADSHCAFHFATGTGITISNSFVHHNAYGLMAGSLADGHIVHNNFEDNGVNIGACSAAAAEVKDNYFSGGVVLDQSCLDDGLTVTGTAPANAYPTGVGPSP